LSDVVGEIDDSVEFVGCGGDVGSNIEGASDVEAAAVIDLTVGENLGRLNVGGHVESSLNLPRVAAVCCFKNDTLSAQFLLPQIA
jgi:hypothetical protein